MSNIQKQVGARVRAARTALGLSQGELAERAGLGVETVSRIERGVQGATLENLLRLSRAMNLSLPVLFDFDRPDDQVVRSVTISEVISLLDDADERTVKLTYQILRVLLAED